MTDINLNICTEFGTVEQIYNCWHDKEGLFEFVKNVVMNMNKFDEHNKNGYGIMLKDLSNIYVLVSNKFFPFNNLKPSQKNSIDLSSAKQNFVLGYIWLFPFKIINEDGSHYHLISYIDSRISGLNIVKYMIHEFEFEFGEKRNLLPYEIASSSAKYWKKYFMEKSDIKTKQDLQNMIKELKLKHEDIKWNELFLKY